MGALLSNERVAEPVGHSGFWFLLWPGSAPRVIQRFLNRQGCSGWTPTSGPRLMGPSLGYGPGGGVISLVIKFNWFKII